MHKLLPMILGAAAAVSLPSVAVQAQSAGETTVLGPFTGHYAKLHPDNIDPHLIAYYGTDLGWSYEHKGKIHFLFGDTHATESGGPIEASSGHVYDDSFGTIDLAEWRDPARITPANIPLIKLGQNPGTTEMSAINPGHAMEGFKTPLGGFSNGAREFALFYTAKPEGCRVDADCDGGLVCDTGLGFRGPSYESDQGITLACMDGDPGCNVDPLIDARGEPVVGSGFCSDKRSSVWADTQAGRISATAFKHLIGIRNTSDPRLYTHTQTWMTNKFANVAVRTVQDFVPKKAVQRATQQYLPAGESGANRKVFLWGRPGFIGVGARGRPLGLYFGYVDMPAGPEYSWNVHYYAGIDGKGAPRFVTSESEAVAADMDSATAGVQAEAHDIVNQMSISWIEHLGKWVMFYGGGAIRLPRPPELANCGVLEFFTLSECKDVVTGNGALRMRTADNPWGPWSAPQDLIVGGDPEAKPLSGQFTAGGVLRHPACTQPGCAPHTDAEPTDEYGFLYGANIVEQWIKPAGSGVEVIWNASTWDPYRVILLRTRINR